jgi:hypothetical protein
MGRAHISWRQAVGACWLAAAAAAQPATLSVDDVVALQGQRHWVELLERAAEVPPPARTAAWREAVEAAARGVLEQHRAKGDAVAALDEMEAWVRRYPHVATSALVQDVARAQVGRAWRQCLDTRAGAERCAARLSHWAGAGAAGARELAAAADDLSPAEWQARLQLAESALRVDAARLPCDAPWLTDALTRQAGAEASSAATEGLLGHCGPLLGKQVLARLLDSKAGLARYCPALLRHASFGGVQRARCERAAKEARTP